MSEFANKSVLITGALRDRANRHVRRWAQHALIILRRNLFQNLQQELMNFNGYTAPRIPYYPFSRY